MAGGRFITFEGGEGCGKSTQVRLLCDRLRAAGHTVSVLREPGGTPLGEALRQILKHDPVGRGMAPETELLLMNASRAELVRQVIRPALEAGTMVVCDRFHDSTRAYQGHGRGLAPEAVEAVVGLAVDGTRPDLTFWLRLPREVARRRIASRMAESAEPDRFEAEKEAFFTRVDAGYRTLADAEPGRWVVVDADRPTEAVAKDIWDAVTSRFPGLASTPAR
jgi:dTMP kinase